MLLVLSSFEFELKKGKNKNSGPIRISKNIRIDICLQLIFSLILVDPTMYTYIRLENTIYIDLYMPRKWM
jgi:hypothetical protein